MNEPDALYQMCTGTAALRILSIDAHRNTAWVRYCASGIETEIPLEKIIPYRGAIKEIPMARQLYQIKDTDTYALRIATDSQGRAVVEVKGSGEIRAIDPKDLIEVLPYTVGVRFLTSNQVYNYFAKPDQYAVGDLLIGSGTDLATVVALDTKSKQANKWFAGWKLAATQLETGE